MVEAIIDGIINSPPVLCLALAYGICYGLLGMMDLTIGPRVAIAGYCGWVISKKYTLLGHPAFSPILYFVAFIGVICVSILFFRLLKPLQRGKDLTMLIGSLGLAVVTTAILQYSFGSRPRVFTSYPVEVGREFLGTSATTLQIVFLAYSLVVIFIVGLLMSRTGLGIKLNIIATDPELALTVFGLDRNKVEMIGIVIASLIVAPAGLLYCIGAGVSPDSGSQQGLLAFIAAVAAGRRRPLAAPAVGLLLVCFGSIGTRWPVFSLFLLLFFVVFLFWGGKYLPKQMKTGLKGRFFVISLLSIGLFIILVVSHVCLPFFHGTILGNQIPSAYQPLLPYILIIFGLLWRPEGVFAFRKKRTV